MSINNSTNDLKHWLILNHAKGIGPNTIQKLLRYFKSPKKIINTNETDLKKCGLKPDAIKSIKFPAWQFIEQELTWTRETNHHILTLSDPQYPFLLKEIADPPPILYIKGNPTCLSLPQIAIVGSRNPTCTGKEIAHQFAYHLAQSGICITSGLALGIDTASHQGALQDNQPTIAILGSGFDHIYPKSNQKLAEKITEKGALVSEFAIHSAPIAGHFPRRNRIISGLSMGTLVVEATVRSGSLITANFAAEQGREVFAIPGSIHNPQSRGCHALIRQGAKLIENMAEILEEIPLLNTKPNDEKQKNSIPTTNHQHPLEKLAEDEQKLLECIGYEPTCVDQMVERSDFSAAKVSSILLILELHGYICAVPGGSMRVKL